MSIPEMSNPHSDAIHAMRDFYRRQSLITNPGRHHDRLAIVARDTRTMAEAVGRMVLNFVSDRTLIDQALFHARLSQVDLRTVPAMLDALDRIACLPLEAERLPEQRMIGNCRDVAVLACAALRARGIPARARYGFGHRFYDPAEPLHEHVVTEFAAPDWQMIDCRATSEIVARYSVPLVPGQTLPAGFFQTALDVWRDCRAGRRDFAGFSSAKDDPAHGMWYVSRLVYLDLASLHGFEALMWDVWGPQVFRTAPLALDDPEELQLLDLLAALDPRRPEDWSRMRLLYHDSDMIRVPRQIVSCSPYRGLCKWVCPAAKNPSRSFSVSTQSAP